MHASFFCIHGHFYQPPRTDPFTRRVPREPDAAPYANWNERITAECYAPLAERRLFGRISFNLGATLARWLDEHAHAVYEQIVAQERLVYQADSVGNGLAQPVHHTILPLARRRDKICQVRWGIASFIHRFGHPPDGMWLPEMAVDLETLGVMATAGVRFTILSDQHVRGDLTDGAGPYRVRLPHKREIAVFVRDRPLSDALAFQMPAPSDADRWLSDHLEWRSRRGGLILIATDGETFGHHHPQGVDVLDRLLAGARMFDCSPMVSLGKYLRDHPPHRKVEVVENTAWSCEHNLARWALGCPCTPGDGRWKAALRRALDNLTSELDEVYACETQRLGLAPWPLRDAYIAVVLGQTDGMAFLSGNGLSYLTTNQARRLLWLLEAQFYRQRMFASCTFFFEDLDRCEPRYAIANAIRALALTRYATGEDLTPGFRRDLRLAVSWRTGRTGADILDELLR